AGPGAARRPPPPPRQLTRPRRATTPPRPPGADFVPARPRRASSAEFVLAGARRGITNTALGGGDSAGGAAGGGMTKARPLSGNRACSSRAGRRVRHFLLRRWWRVLRSSLRCFFLAIRLRRFLMTEPIRPHNVRSVGGGPTTGRSAKWSKIGRASCRERQSVAVEA